jgi:hypothetical protein
MVRASRPVPTKSCCHVRSFVRSGSPTPPWRERDRSGASPLGLRPPGTKLLTTHRSPCRPAAAAPNATRSPPMRVRAPVPHAWRRVGGLCGAQLGLLTHLMIWSCMLHIFATTDRIGPRRNDPHRAGRIRSAPARAARRGALPVPSYAAEQLASSV